MTCKATLNFVRSHFPFHGEGSCRCLHSRPRCLGRRDGQAPAYAALVRHAGAKAGDFAYGLRAPLFCLVLGASFGQY